MFGTAESNYEEEEEGGAGRVRELSATRKPGRRGGRDPKRCDLDLLLFLSFVHLSKNLFVVLYLLSV